MSPSPAPPAGTARSRLTLHVVTTVADLDRLGRQLANCIASYGRPRMTGMDRIVEVREDGQPLYAVHIHAGRIVMFEASHNRPPPRADVPVVRDLLAEAGLLRPPAPRVQRPVPVPVREPPPPARQLRLAPATPPAEPRLSVQELATDLLRPPALGRTEWPELAAALWAVGVLPRLPDPAETVFERVVLDLAARISVGEDAGIPRRDPPPADEITAARRRLLAGPPPRTSEAWQRHRMADVLAVPVVP